MQELLKIHPHPLTSTSVFSEDEYITNIDDLERIYGKSLTAIIDGGIVKVEMSTIIDYTQRNFNIIREGKGSERLQNYLGN